MYGFPVDNNGVERQALVDLKGHARIIEYAHNAVHDDIFVTASEYVADLDIASPRSYLVVPPTGYDVHSVFNIQCSSPCRVQLYKDPTKSANGTALTHMRHHLGSAADRDSTYHTPTVTDNGILILDTYTGGSANNPNNRIGGETRNGEEIVIPNDVTVLIIVTATADNTVMSFANEYYEVAV